MALHSWRFTKDRRHASAVILRGNEGIQLTIILTPLDIQKHPDDTISYNIINPPKNQTMIWSIERDLTKIRRAKIIKHDVIHIL